jgi:hypothetical protein
MVTEDNLTKMFKFPDATTLQNTGNIYSVNGLKLQGGSTTVMTLQDTLTKCNTDFQVGGKCVVGGPSVLESALQVCNYRTVLPTQYGVHAGRDWAEFPGSSNCGINICADNTGVSHLDFSYVGNTNYYNGQITYDNSANTMQFFTNQVIKLREWC